MASNMKPSNSILKLPLYSAIESLTEYIVTGIINKHMSNFLKETIGKNLLELCIEIIRLIPIANRKINTKEERIKTISLIIENVDLIKINIKLLRKFKCITEKKYSVAVGLAADVGRQAQGWINYLEGNDCLNKKNNYSSPFENKKG